MHWQKCSKQENWASVVHAVNPVFSVDQVTVLLLLLAVVGFAQVLDRTLILTNERSSIERTYELTKYLDHQLKEIRDTYVSHSLFVCVCKWDAFVYRCFPVNALRRLFISWMHIVLITLQKMIFCLSIFVLFSSINIYKFLNQDAFTWQVKWLFCLVFWKYYPNFVTNK